MKKQQINKKPGKAKVQKSSKAVARKKPVANNKKKVAVKAKPAKKAVAKSPVTKKAKPSKPVAPPKQSKPVKKVATEKEAKGKEKKALVAKPLAKQKVKTTAATNDVVLDRPVERPLNERPLSNKQAPPEGEKIKLRIDARTIITVRSKEALKMWMQRYPNAVQED